MAVPYDWTQPSEWPGSEAPALAYRQPRAGANEDERK